jgi:hypothetical protein
MKFIFGLLLALALAASATTVASAASRLPTYLSPQSVKIARQHGWAVDASKLPAMVTVLHYNSATKRVSVTLSIQAAFGGNIGGVQYSTENGVYRIYLKKGSGFVSTLYPGAKMAWATFFHGGEAFHHDGLFPSHGCVHIPSMTAAKYIHDLPMGTTVVVHG